LLLREGVGRDCYRRDRGGGQVSCLVDSVKAQDIKFYGEKKEKPLDFNAVAGTTQVSLSWG
jgi:hypothetical protein